jgi:hypothetical protein
MKPILMVWADAGAVPKANPSAAVNANNFLFFMIPPSENVETR